MKAKGGGDRFLQVTDTVYNSIAFRTLPGSALKLWIDLRVQFKGWNNGSLMITLSAQKHRGWNSASKLYKARDALLERGLIAYTRKCNENKFHQASLYAFTDLDVAANDRNGIVGSRKTEAFLAWVPASTVKRAAKRAFPTQEPNGSQNRRATVPEIGERVPETVPEMGKRQNSPKGAPVLALHPIRPAKASLS